MRQLKDGRQPKMLREQGVDGQKKRPNTISIVWSGWLHLKKKNAILLYFERPLK